MNGRAGASLLLGLLACQEPGRPAQPAQASQRPAQSGLRVPLPEGWSLRPLESRVFLAGPSEDSRLRIEVLPDGHGASPSRDEWRSQVRQQVPGVVFSEDTEDSDFFILSYQAPTRHRAFLGAKRQGGRWMTCSSMGPATEAEITLAKEACRNLGWTSVSR